MNTRLTCSRDVALRIGRLFAWLGLALLAVESVSAQTPPSITRQPKNLSRSPGDRATLNVAITGSAPLAFQWFHDGTLLSAGTNATLTLTNLTAADAGAYTVLASNPDGSITSDPARLEVDTLFTLVADSVVSRFARETVAWGDYDGDGWPDLYSGDGARSMLFHNERDGTFTRVGSTNAIVARAVGGDNLHAAWADYNNDGNLDLVVSQGFVTAPKLLFRGLGEGRFQWVTNAPLARDLTPTTSAVWADFNRDGLLDLYFTAVGAVAPIDATSLSQTIASNLFYLGRSDGSFARWYPSGASQVSRRYGATSGDFNGDGWPDLVVPSYPDRANMLFENREGQDFDVIQFFAGGGFGGSPSAADYDNDEDLDVFVSWNTDHSHFFRNDGAGNFERLPDIAPALEPGRADSCTWGDFNNDGWIDLFVSRHTLNSGGSDWNDSLYQNNGDGTFTRVPAGSVGNDGMQSSGAAWADFNNDGFLDLLVTTADSSPSRLYRNNGNANGWLLLKLVGTKSNRSAIGAKVRLRSTIRGTSLTQLREVGVGAGWFSQNDLRVHFGLGDASQAEAITIEWPSGQKQVLSNVAGRQILTVTEPDDRARIAWENPGSGRPGKLVISGPADTRVILEHSADLTAWVEGDGVTLGPDGIGEATVAERSGTATFFRVRLP